ncbi:hypothetical protein D0809_29465, partial [Flavobacterium circumlabens]
TGRQPDLFSSAMHQSYTPPVTNTAFISQKQEAVGDLFSFSGGNDQAAQPAIYEPAPYSGGLQPFHRNDCLVADNGWVGHLQDVDTLGGTAVFHPLQLPISQKARA